MDVGTGGGKVKLDGVPLPYYPYTLQVAKGATIIFEAVPSFGRVFSGWSGDILPDENMENPLTLKIECNTDITAGFAADRLLLGIGAGSLALIILLGSVLYFRRKTDTTRAETDSSP